MPTIISRAEWGARPPTSVVTTTWARKTEFIVHYSGASRTQTVKSIQDYCMDSKGHSDIDYCFVVKDGLIYEGRGWLNIGSHTFGHNTVGIGVCVIGRDGDATGADRAAVRWLYDEGCRMAGRMLKQLGHQDANPGTTDCPGSQLEAWVRAGMPGPEGDDVSDAYELLVEGKRPGFAEGDQTHSETLDGTVVSLSNANALADIQRGGFFSRRAVERLAALEAKVDALATGGLTAAAVAAELAKLLPAPPSAQQIAEAVLDEDHARSAD